MASRPNVLGVYKNLVKIARRLPEPNRSQSLRHIRQEFRSNKGESSVERVEELLTKANSSLGYLKIIAPRTRVSSGQTGVTKLVFGKDDGSGGKKAVTNWHGANMDPDSVKRHYQSLKRAGFRNNSEAKGGFF